LAINPAIGLTDAIEALRTELMGAIDRGQGERMRFALEPIELTVQAVVSKGANGTVGWSILSAGGRYSATRTQTLTLRLTPLWIADEGGKPTSDFTLGATAEPGDIIASRG
jgi:hypothetical protein